MTYFSNKNQINVHLIQTISITLNKMLLRQASTENGQQIFPLEISRLLELYSFHIPKVYIIIYPINSDFF